MSHRILHMTLHKRWFDDIVAGRKTEEYREIKPYWEKRLAADYDVICFKNGYRKDCPEMLIKYHSYVIKSILNPMTNNFETVFALQLGEIIEIRNYEKAKGNHGKTAEATWQGRSDTTRPCQTIF